MIFFVSTTIFQLLFRGVIVEELVDVRDAVERDAVLKRAHREFALGRTVQKLARLVVQLGIAGAPAPLAA